MSFGLLGTGAEPTYSGHCVLFVGSPAACFGGDFMSLFLRIAVAKPDRASCPSASLRERSEQLPAMQRLANPNCV